MKKVYKLEDLDCANCAAKMEKAIKELPEIRDASVNFMMQKMTLEFDDAMDEKALMKKVVKLIKKVEPDCSVIL